MEKKYNLSLSKYEVARLIAILSVAAYEDGRKGYRHTASSNWLLCGKIAKAMGESDQQYKDFAEWQKNRLSEELEYEYKW